MAFTPREFDTNKLVTVHNFGNCEESASMKQAHNVSLVVDEGK